MKARHSMYRDFYFFFFQLFRFGPTIGRRNVRTVFRAGLSRDKRGVTLDANSRVTTAVARARKTASGRAGGKEGDPWSTPPNISARAIVSNLSVPDPAA